MSSYFDPVSYFFPNPSWRILTTEGQEYNDQRQEVHSHMGSPAKNPVPRLSPKARDALDQIYYVVDLTHTLANYAKMGTVPLFATLFFVNLSTSMFFVVVWYANSFAIALLGLLYHDFSKIEEGTFHLKNIFVLVTGRDNDPILRTGEIPSMYERDGNIRLTSTLIHIRNAIREIERMQQSIKVLSYFSYPLRTPLENVKANLVKIETHIKGQLT